MTAAYLNDDVIVKEAHRRWQMSLPSHWEGNSYSAIDAWMTLIGAAAMGASMAVVCRQRLGDNPLEGAVYVFRNRSGTALKLLLYDGQGFWLLMKRLSQGRFPWWPKTPDVRVPLSARELLILLWNGDPERAQMAQDWRRVLRHEVVAVIVVRREMR